MSTHTDTDRTPDALYLRDSYVPTPRYLARREALRTLLAESAYAAVPRTGCARVDSQRELHAYLAAVSYMDVAPDATSAWAAYDDAFTALADLGLTRDRYSYLSTVLTAVESAYYAYAGAVA